MIELSEYQVPRIIAINSLALGAAYSGVGGQPIDSVSSWLIEKHPQLLPFGDYKSVLTTLRLRCLSVDRVVAEYLRRVRDSGETRVVVTIGGGLDARWRRLCSQYEGVVSQVQEVEDPDILLLKELLLQESPYDEEWEKVLPCPDSDGSFLPTETYEDPPIFVLDLLDLRMGSELFLQFLTHLHGVTEKSIVVGVLPGCEEDEVESWSCSALHQLGWKVIEEERLYSRDELTVESGEKLCYGRFSMRVVLMEWVEVP